MYTFVTVDEIRNLDGMGDEALLVIKAPTGTKLNLSEIQDRTGVS